MFYFISYEIIDVLLPNIVFYTRHLLFPHKAKKKNLVFRAMVLKTLGRVGSVCFKFVFLRIETTIIKTI